MKRVIIRDDTIIPPFGEPARELRILNKPLWLMQRDLLKTHCKGSTEIKSVDELQDMSTDDEELLVYRDNLFFNSNLIEAFISEARAAKKACQIAFRATTKDQKGDSAIERHGLRMQEGIRREGDVYVADLYYFPSGQRDTPQPLIIDTQSDEMGYYHIPSYMADRGDLVYQVPIRAFLSIENWVHVFFANTPMGVFGWAREQDSKMDRARIKDFFKWTDEDWKIFPEKISLVLTAFWEQRFGEKWRNHFLACSKLVKVGKNCSIDPTAVIHGPTVIGDNVYIGPGVVITNSLIGSNVNVMQGSQVMLSVVSDRCFLPFNAALFMTTLMENSMIAQNSTLQLCVVGRNTFIGANNCFTDFNLQNEPIKTLHKGQLEEVGMPVLGSAVGHNVKIGSGFIVYPGRTIGSNAVIIFDNDKNLIRKGVPGRSPDDIDEENGEPRRIVYHWPNVFRDPDKSSDGTAQESYTYENGVEQAATMELPQKNKSASPVRVNATVGRIDL